jgi:hypothetical protein
MLRNQSSTPLSEYADRSEADNHPMRRRCSTVSGVSFRLLSQVSDSDKLQDIVSWEKEVQ